MNERWQFDRQRACVDKSILIRKTTHIHKWVWCWTELSRDEPISKRIEWTTPQSGHYPITGWAHVSGDSNFNCSCILIAIMRFTTDIQRIRNVNNEQKEISVWQRYKYLKWSIIMISLVLDLIIESLAVFSFSLLKSGIFTSICDCCCLSSGCVNYIDTWTTYLQSSNPLNDASFSFGNRKSSSMRNFLKKIRCRRIQHSICSFELYTKERWVPLDRKWIAADRLISVTYFILYFEAKK